MSGGPVAGEASARPKQDPESLVLRGRPQPVVRFRRGLVAGAAAAVAAGVVALAWLALEPPSLKVVAAEEPGGPPDRPSLEALAGAPGSYGDVPRLGPPLPGDLGRPILEHQRQMRSLPAIEDGPGTDRPAPVRMVDRSAASIEAVRASALLVELASRPPEPPAATFPAPEGSLGQGEGAAAPPASPISLDRLTDPPSPWILSAGSVIPASLVTGVRSDRPGLVVAQVTENVSDSATGRTVLIPQGARLIGRYDSKIAFGDRRALVVWDRIVLPDGSSLQLDSMPAADPAGYAGLEDKVDFHSRRLIQGIGLSSLLGIGAQLGLGGEGELERALAESALRNAQGAGEQLTARNLEVRPTLTVRPGWPVRAVVHKDLVLRPWKG